MYARTSLTSGEVARTHLQLNFSSGCKLNKNIPEESTCKHWDLPLHSATFVFLGAIFSCTLQEGRYYSACFIFIGMRVIVRGNTVFNIGPEKYKPADGSLNHIQSKQHNILAKAIIARSFQHIDLKI